MNDANPNKAEPDEKIYSSRMVWLGLILGFLLWFGYFTDYSLAGTIPDLLFPALVGIVAIKAIGQTSYRLIKYILGLHVLAGFFPLFVILISLIPPFLLGFLFAASEVAGETRIQREASPDGVRMADVYFRPVGPYASGNGRVYVRIKYRLFPLVERDVFAHSGSHADEDTDDYVSWKDNDTLYVPETFQEIKLGFVEGRIPGFIYVVVSIIHFFDRSTS